MKRKMSVDIEDIIQKRSNHPNIRRSSTVVLESDDFLRERNINQGLEKQKKTQKEEKARKPKLKLKEPSQEEEIDPRVIRELMLEKLMQPGQDQK